MQKKKIVPLNSLLPIQMVHGLMSLYPGFNLQILQKFVKTLIFKETILACTHIFVPVVKTQTWYLVKFYVISLLTSKGVSATGHFLTSY